MRKSLLAVMGVVLLLLILGAVTSVTGAGSTHVVNSTSDTDDGTCNGSHCSLKEAINAANGNPGADTIEFNIPKTDSGYSVGVSGTWTISLTAGLPPLIDDGTTIDGFTQALNQGDTNPDGPEIEITGANLDSGSCVTIYSDNNGIRGLVINRCPWRGVDIYSGGNANEISGNYVGTDATGKVGLGNGLAGICIVNGCQDNVIGGDTAAERNVISGNDMDGVLISGGGTTGNTISGNYIGTDASGTVDLGNSRIGVFIAGGAQDNVIGGDTAGERNVISGNDQRGVYISHGGTMSNTISGNYIGTDATGAKDLGNTWNGVFIASGAHDNVIGGDTPGERNVISGNGGDGVLISGSATTSNTVSGNYIGTDITGAAKLGNGSAGVWITGGCHDNLVGGGTAAERNVISGNAHGVHISGSGTMSNTITGNYIGTDASGALNLGNSGDGVYIADGAQSNVIGGGTVAESNVIALNDFHGVRVDGTTTTGNTITENSIHSNGGLGILLMNGGNTELTAPTIALADCLSLYFGTAPGNATVELFTGPDEEGKTYLTTVSADGGGNWILWDSFTLDTYVTATATDAAGNTSEFSTQVSPGPCYQVFVPLVMKGY